MSIQSKANWIRGFLVSLENSDAISQKQIKVLKKELNELLDEVENYFDEGDEVDKPDVNIPVATKVSPPKPSSNINDHMDLPF